MQLTAVGVVGEAQALQVALEGGGAAGVQAHDNRFCRGGCGRGLCRGRGGSGKGLRVF